MRPLQDVYASLSAGNTPQAPAPDISAPGGRDEARRYLLRMLARREFCVTVFMARKYFFNGIIRVEDLNFFMTSVSTALKNGHSDVMNN